MLPQNFKSRAFGLLGDLACHRSEFETATDFYSEAFGWTGNPASLLSSEALRLFASRISGSTSFFDGIAHYHAAPPLVAPLDDASLALPSSSQPPASSAWESFSRLPLLDSQTSIQIREALQSPENLSSREIAKICQDHSATIAALRGLGSVPLSPNADDLDATTAIQHAARLMMLSAWLEQRDGSPSDALFSFDTAYRLLRIFEARPRFVSLLGTLALRGEFASLLESPSGEGLRPLFTADCLLSPNAWDLAARGDYQATKRLLSSTIPVTDARSRRFRDLMLEKLAFQWRLLQTRGPSGEAASPVSAFQPLSAWFFKNRRFFHRPGTISDGETAAAELDASLAEMTVLINVPNVGPLDRQIADITSRERALLNRAAK